MKQCKFIKQRCFVCLLLHCQALMGVETPPTFLTYHLRVLQACIVHTAGAEGMDQNFVLHSLVN